MDKSKYSPFDYLLNAMEYAAQQDDPWRAGYPSRRQAVLEYVRKLEKVHPEGGLIDDKRIREIAEGCWNYPGGFRAETSMERVEAAIRSALREAAQPEGEPTPVERMLGAAMADALQEDFDGCRELARGVKLEFVDGAPVVRLSALTDYYKERRVTAANQKGNK
jgi:hypothetical protein